jgi:hypothetical protein
MPGGYGAPMWGAAAPMMPPLPDDGLLANLLLSWYYSGYYTAMYMARRGPQ